MSTDSELEATISDLNGTRLQEVNGCGLHGGRKVLAPGGSQKAEQLYVGFTCGNFGPCNAPEEKVGERIKIGGRQKQKCNLGPSALFTGVNNYLSEELSQLSARANAKRNGRPFLANKRPATMFVLFLPSTKIFLAKTVYMVLGSSQYQRQVKPFACKPNTENILRQDSSPVILLLGSSFLQVNSQ